MKASTLLIVGVAGALAFLYMRQHGMLSSVAATSRPSTTSGTQNTVPKSDYQATVDDITSIFANVTKLMGGNQAQTAPKTT